MIVGYFTYGKLTDLTFGPDDRETPAIRLDDGVDYVVLPRWKLFLVELLNIAGLGPIFGALQGALFGPVVFLWITFGTIFVGGVHDYFSGMLSERNDGKSIAEVTGTYLGPTMKNVMRVFSVVLLIMVGTVFAKGPAGLLVTMLKAEGWEGLLANESFWLAIVFTYYLVATFISVDKVIGRLYPIFGICLIVMAAGVLLGIVGNTAYQVPEIWNSLYNMHPEDIPIWPFMFITVACGAVSGFHSTQAPIMARCMKSEGQGRFVFYGAMVAEGIIALIWAAAGCALYERTGGLNGLVVSAGLHNMLQAGQSAAVYDVCLKSMGTIGVPLAMIGVIACPITSGDTAFRSARLTISDWFNIDNRNWRKRLALTVPILGSGVIISQLNYAIVWRYFSWTNQTLAMLVLWAASMYLCYEKKNFWITALPATFMSAVSVTYFVMAPECLGMLDFFYMNQQVAYTAGICTAGIFLGIFMRVSRPVRHGKKTLESLMANGVIQTATAGASSTEDTTSQPSGSTSQNSESTENSGKQ